MSLLRIEHRTSYRYGRPVRASKNEVRMTPAVTPGQRTLAADLRITPEPTHRAAYRDYFGTVVESFEVMPPHEALDVVYTADVEGYPQPEPEIRETGEPDERAVEYAFASPMVAWDASLAALASSLRAGGTVATVRATLDWMQTTLTYEPGTTIVGTSVAEVIRDRRGVCQDYAHVCCALLRSLEIPARYVSGYFAPKPLDPGESAQAQSHAWVEVLVPGWGWWAVDPTNDLPAGERHIKVGHGRDYSDVVPFQGVHVGGAEQTLEVAVTITRPA